MRPIDQLLQEIDSIIQYGPTRAKCLECDTMIAVFKETDRLLGEAVEHHYDHLLMERMQYDNLARYLKKMNEVG